jgi:hypothetical protein
VPAGVSERGRGGCFAVFRSSNASIAARSQKLLQLALDLDDLPHSGKAFTMLMTPCDLVSQRIIDGDELEKVADKVLVSPPVGVVINRFAAISQRVFLSSPDRFVGKTLGLQRFLPFLGFRSVFDMFTAILDQDDKARALQAVLRAEGFVGSVVAAIDALPDDVTDVNHAVMLFKVLSILSESKVFGDLMAAPAVLTSVLREFAQPPTPLLNAQWAAVSAVLFEQNLPVLMQHLPRILGFIRADGDSFFPYQVTAIELIRKLITNKGYRQDAVGQGLIEGIAYILRKFNRHTIVQKAITRFVIGAFQFDDFGPQLLQAVLPMVSQAIHATSIEERGCAWSFIKDIRDSHGREVAESGVDQSAWQKFLEITQVADTPYGGEKPAPPEPVGEAPNAQVIALLMQLLLRSQGR